MIQRRRQQLVGSHYGGDFWGTLGDMNELDSYVVSYTILGNKHSELLDKLTAVSVAGHHKLVHLLVGMPSLRDGAKVSE